MPERIREVAEQANVPEGFVRRLVALGALPAEEAELGPREVRRARLLQAWAAAGLSVETIAELVERGTLSLGFLDGPVMARPERLDRSYRQLADDRDVPLAFLRALHQALGFAPPEPGARAGEDDVTVLDIAELFRGAGVGDDATLRLLVVYADSLRRIAQALELPETELYGLLDRRARDQLPPLQPYLRAKYDLPDAVIADITAYLSRYGDLSTGPRDGEDEEPEAHQH